MSYQQYYPPPGYRPITNVYPPPQTYPPESQNIVPSPSPSYPYPYPPSQSQPPVYQGYLAQDYPPPQPPTQPPYHYQCEHGDDHDDDDSSSFLRGCLTALCFCCVLEECF